MHHFSKLCAVSPSQGLTGFILGRCASSSDMTLTRRGMCLILVCFSYWSHSARTSALKPFNFSNTACRRIRLSCWHLILYLGPFMEMFHILIPPLQTGLRPSSASTVDSCTAKSSGTSVLSAQMANRIDGEQNSGHFHHLQCVGGWEERKGSAPGSFGTY